MCRFLLVSLKIKAILGEMTIRQRRMKLEEIARSNGPSDIYTATLRRLKEQKGNKSVLGMKVLMWVSYSERPLRTEELCHALGVEIGSVDPNPDNIPTLRTLLSSCLGLVAFEDSSSTVRLVHSTLQQHLLRDPTLFHNPHSTMAEVCLTYLNFRCVSDLSPTLHSAPSGMPLLEYASLYWGKHANIGITENVKALALRLLDRFDHHLSAHLLLLHHHPNSDPWGRSYGARGPVGFTGLHGVSFLGIAEIAGVVLNMKEWDVNTTDCMGGTPLTWAARRGHEEVVKMLLELEDVNPNTVDSLRGRTALSLAAEKGCDGVVKVLLEREDVNPNTGDSLFGRTPLLWAAENGCEGVVKMLLEREDVSLDLADTEYGRTPLSWAAQKGHEGVVNMLLEREDINPDQPDTFCGRTPLSWAAESGREEVVRMLLERGEVNSDQPDIEYGRTPLSWAAQKGHEGVVKMLLERDDVNPDQADTEYGRTPLSREAQKGHEGIVKMLLERKAVNPDKADTEYGRTPLSRAAQKGHEGIVKMLLEREDVNPDQPDTKYGRTPLSWAAEGGHEGVVRLLSERKYARTATPDEINQTPQPSTPSEGDDGVASTPPAPSPADPKGREAVLGPNDPLPQPPDGDLPSTKPSRLPRLRSICPLKFWFPPRKTNIHPNNLC